MFVFEFVVPGFELIFGIAKTVLLQPQQQILAGHTDREKIIVFKSR
jgi:hypothetical protein